MPPLLRVAPEVEDEQVARLQKLKAGRNKDKVEHCLSVLKSAAHNDEELMGPVLACVREYATLGEICDVLRQVFGEYRDRQ